MTQEGAKPARSLTRFSYFSLADREIFLFFQPLAEEIGPAKQSFRVVGW